MSDEEWTAEQCAAYWGVKADTWHGYVSKSKKLPPDRRLAPLPVRYVGRTPVWNAAEVRAYQRPGQGARTDKH